MESWRLKRHVKTPVESFQRFQSYLLEASGSIEKSWVWLYIRGGICSFNVSAVGCSAEEYFEKLENLGSSGMERRVSHVIEVNNRREQVIGLFGRQEGHDRGIEGI